MGFCGGDCACGEACTRLKYHRDEQRKCADCERTTPLVTFYAVKDVADNVWYMTGMRGRDAGWSCQMKDARIWTNVSHARSKITALANEGHENIVLVEFHVTSIDEVDQTARIVATRQKKQAEKALRERNQKERALKEAQAELDRAIARLNALKKVK